MLTFIRESDKRASNGGKFGFYHCSSCNKEVELPVSCIKRGQQFCKCILKTMRRTHGMRRSAEYRIWCHIKDRCCNPNCHCYKHYGGRGIKVCDRWLHSFENFFADMGFRPSPELKIERLNNDGDYCPENCKWATNLEEQNNRTNNHFEEWNGKNLTIAQWSRELNMSENLLRGRIVTLGWSAEKAFTTPVKNKKSDPPA